MAERTVNRRAVLLAGVALAAPALGGCASGPAPGRPLPARMRPLPSAGTRANLALTQVANLTDVVSGIRHFGASCYAANARADRNFTLSPLSIAVAFGMLRGGSRGSTASAIDAAFGFPTGTVADGAVHPALNALTATLVTDRPAGTEPSPTASDGRPPPPIVGVANGLFLDLRLASAVRREFLQILATQYGADPIGVDFGSGSAAAAINAWVAQATRNRIRSLFDSLDAGTVLVLANAVYLKAAWAQQFDPTVTRDGQFRAPGGGVTASFMQQSLQHVAYAAGDGWQRVAVPYAGDLTMRVAVPTRPVTTVGALAPAMIAALAPSTRDDETTVTLSLPRWSTESALDLTSALPKLGLRVPFTPAADFSGIAPGLRLSQANHRANLTVDERDTEAAAVTGLAMATSADSRQVELRADRPFAWAIVHEPTGTPVFLGHVVNPAG